MELAEDNPVLSNKIELYQNYPNPFNPSTTIKYNIPDLQTHSHASVHLSIYDILGREVATLVNEKQNPGLYEVTLDGGNLSSGIYYYRLRVGNNINSKKMILLK